MGRILHSSRRLVCLMLLGVLAFVSGCGDDKGPATGGPAGDEQVKQQQNDIRAAREKAGATGGLPKEAPAK